MRTGIQLITEERQKQIDKHGFTAEHHALNSDKWYHNNQLIEASNTLSMPIIKSCLVPLNWDIAWFSELCKKPYKERLIIAGALIAAELDRLNYIEENNLSGRV